MPDVSIHAAPRLPAETRPTAPPRRGGMAASAGGGGGPRLPRAGISFDRNSN
jgi:hypothetical protein